MYFFSYNKNFNKAQDNHERRRKFLSSESVCRQNYQHKCIARHYFPRFKKKNYHIEQKRIFGKNHVKVAKLIIIIRRRRRKRTEASCSAKCIYKYKLRNYIFKAIGFIYLLTRSLLIFFF